MDMFKFSSRNRYHFSKKKQLQIIAFISYVNDATIHKQNSVNDQIIALGLSYK